MWKWLYENPECSKDDYYKGIHEVWKSGCPCCEYYLGYKEMGVNEACEVNDFKAIGKCPLSSIKLCKFSCYNSAFSIWLNPYSEAEKKENAKIIYDALIEYYDEKWG